MSQERQPVGKRKEIRRHKARVRREFVQPITQVETMQQRARKHLDVINRELLEYLWQKTGILSEEEKQLLYNAQTGIEGKGREVSCDVNKLMAKVANQDAHGPDVAIAQKRAVQLLERAWLRFGLYLETSADVTAELGTFFNTCNSTLHDFLTGYDTNQPLTRAQVAKSRIINPITNQLDVRELYSQQKPT